MSDALRQWGTGPDRALLLHCSLAHSGAWDGVAQHLSAQLRMTAPDLIGHGRAPDWDPAQDFHDQTTAQVAALLPEGRCHMIGHSFGATVALRLAETYPAKIASLTLIEPVLFAAAPDSAGQVAHLAAMDGLEAALEAADLAQAARIFLAYWGGSVPYDRLPPPQRDYMTARVPLIGASHAALHNDRANLLPGLGRVNMPVLLIEGSASPPVISEILDRLAADLPQARRVVIPGAGHMAPISHPEPVAAEIADLIRAPQARQTA